MYFIFIILIFIILILKNFVKCSELFIDKYTDIIVIDDFITEKECNIIINDSKPYLVDSSIFNNDTQKSIVTKYRTSKTAYMNPNNITYKINKKLENMINISRNNYEPLQVAKYSKGQYYRPHYDNIEKYNIRDKTLIIYLSDNYTGGYTKFPLLNKKFKLKKGSAILFDNLDTKNNTHLLSLHQGTTVYKGDKWIATIWINKSD
jgi:prolyl 4-hydroxylase